MNRFHLATEQQSGIKRFCCQPCVECKVVCLTSVKELALYHWKWLLCHGSWGSIIPSRLWTTDRSSGASAGPGRRLQKDPPRLYDSWRHTEKGSNSKKDEAIVTSSCGPASPWYRGVMISAGGFLFLIALRYDTIQYDALQCDGSDTMLYDTIWCIMIRYDTIRYDKVR